jgi:hypothetical protein
VCFKNVVVVVECEISGSHGEEYEVDSFMGYSAV